ncbi:bifunctional diaminohydroxyphosphoribosylaminopyrimidine deaminase/5-amino-6-(5-phosphoribosylamino)uracil reductase RibD [Lichenicola sp.]|uniref:bifunctional diaminohydroxyphosphoribosylaminopyrimidine deaminase/5-amino-6-(5-phosphoribosylamino)uracil reductase RibD n=1 Tax=Lichenicola sp. TaxID=2804529 RepID=UPI003B00C0EC
MPPEIDAAFRAAVEAACAFVGATMPNPPVGCAVLDAGGRILVAAAHRRAGEPHAEALALRLLDQAGLTAQAATLVVTLEPCNHTGRTGPCTEAILATPIRTVWIGVPDPNTRVTGHGAERLRAAGLAVHTLAHDHPGTAAAQACAALIAPFRHRATTGRPWITVKQALDATGGMTPPPGATTFTSAASLRLAHRLRRCTDAIITGTGTILADTPSFTVRHLTDHPGRRRLLAVLGQPHRLPAAYVQAATARGFDVRPVPRLELLLPTLADAGVLWAMVEAGPTLLRSLREAGLWDDWLTIRRPPLDDAAPDHWAIALARDDGDVSPLSLLPEFSDFLTTAWDDDEWPRDQ